MKMILPAIAVILVLSSACFPSEIKGIVTAIDAAGGTIEVAGVEIITSGGRTVMVDRQKRPAALTGLKEGDYIEIEGRFVEPARFEARKITVGRALPPSETIEVIESRDIVEEAGVQPAAVEKEAAQEPAGGEAGPAPTEPPAPGGDEITGSLQNADAKTRILVVDGTVVTLGAGAKVLGADGKAAPIEKLKRGSKVRCTGTRVSKKEFLAETVRAAK